MAFRDISFSILHNGLSLDIGRHYDHLRNLFGLDRQESDILSLLLTHHIGFAHGEQSYRFLPSFSETEVSAVWDRLINKGFIAKMAIPNTYDESLIPRPAFRLAIQEDISLAEAGAVIARVVFTKAIKRILHEEPPKESPQDALNVTAYLMGCDEEESEYLASVKHLSPMEMIDACLSEYPDTPLVSSVKGLIKDLDKSERLLLFGMMGWFSENFTKTVDDNSFSGALGQAYKKSLPTLLKKGLAVCVYEWDDKNNTAGCEHYRISPRCAEVFKGQEKRFNLGVLSEFGTFTTPEQIEHKDLFFPEEDERGIHRIMAAAAPAEYDRIISGLKERGYRPCLSVLMWGPPGTGKTELARQVARESGRSILVVDVPKLFGIYIGEGAIRLRNLFQTYRYVCAVSSVSPILFMDEADGILGQRITEIRRASDKDSNSCQSVILEELNSLPGLFFATTNLIGNLDQAMRRRFLISEEFHLPDAPTRALLWFTRFPGLTEEQAMDLAESYPLSGGIIDNIASMAVMDEILENRTITAEDLHSYCREQGLGMPKRNRIGF